MSESRAIEDAARIYFSRNQILGGRKLLKNSLHTTLLDFTMNNMALMQKPAEVEINNRKVDDVPLAEISYLMKPRPSSALKMVRSIVNEGSVYRPGDEQYGYYEPTDVTLSTNYHIVDRNAVLYIQPRRETVVTISNHLSRSVHIEPHKLLSVLNPYHHDKICGPLSLDSINVDVGVNIWPNDATIGAKEIVLLQILKSLRERSTSYSDYLHSWLTPSERGNFKRSITLKFRNIGTDVVDKLMTRLNKSFSNEVVTGEGLRLTYLDSYPRMGQTDVNIKQDDDKTVVYSMIYQFGLHDVRDLTPPLSPQQYDEKLDLPVLDPISGDDSKTVRQTLFSTQENLVFIVRGSNGNESAITLDKRDWEARLDMLVLLQCNRANSSQAPENVSTRVGYYDLRHFGLSYHVFVRETELKSAFRGGGYRLFVVFKPNFDYILAATIRRDLYFAPGANVVSRTVCAPNSGGYLSSLRGIP